VSAPRIAGDAPAEVSPARVTVEVRNGGDDPESGISVAFLAGRPDQARTPIGWAPIRIDASGSSLAEVIWTPPAGGDWDLQALVAGAESVASPSVRVKVAAAPSTDLASILLAQGLRPFTGGAITASLTLVVAVAVGLGFGLWNPLRRRAEAADR
jgi:hypothetical protein